MIINRREMLIGSGLVLSLPGCAQGSLRESRQVSDGVPRNRSFQDSWNRGNAPWRTHPNSSAHFHPTHICILHMELTYAGLKAKQVYFSSAHVSPNNWPNNKPRVVSFINHLNANTTISEDHSIYPGLTDFAFDRPHHLVIYVKNEGTDYDKDRPIWFGRELNAKVMHIDRASKNESFFGAVRDSDAGITNGSPNLVYVQNYYHVGDGNGHNHRPIVNEEIAYALKINALVPSIGDASLMVPLIIDPDTGNMGGGHPPPLGGPTPP